MDICKCKVLTICFTLFISHKGHHLAWITLLFAFPQRPCFTPTACSDFPMRSPCLPLLVNQIIKATSFHCPSLGMTHTTSDCMSLVNAKQYDSMWHDQGESVPSQMFRKGECKQELIDKSFLCLPESWWVSAMRTMGRGGVEYSGGRGERLERGSLDKLSKTFCGL